MIARPLAKIPAVALACAMLWTAPAHATQRMAPPSDGAPVPDTAPADAPTPSPRPDAPKADAPKAAAPKAAAPKADAPKADAPKADAPGAPTGEAPNGLTAQREAAVEAAASEPTAENHRAVAQLAERAGDFGAAKAAYEAELAALPPDDAAARARVTDDLARVNERSRGAVADEGASTHRRELDAKWQPPSDPVTSKPGAAVPAGKAKADDRIVRKWYFWVTLAAIAASAAAVTGIAIKASRDEKPDALAGRVGRLPMAGPGLRF